MKRNMILLRLAVAGLVVFMSAIAAADNQYVIKDRKTFEADVSVDPQSTAEILAADRNNVYIVINKQNQSELHLFFKDSKGWRSMSKAIPWFAKSGMFTEQQGPRLYTIANEPTPGKYNVRFQTIISIYEIDRIRNDLEKADATITIPTDKTFSNERCKEGRRLFSISDQKKCYFLLGDCNQAKWDPIAIIGNIISGGHGGFVDWPFLAEIKGDSPVAYYKWPVNYGTNAAAHVRQFEIFENKCHFVSTWHKEYMPSRERIEYSVFDFESSKWSRPEEIFTETWNRDAPVGSPAIQVNNGTICIAWSRQNDKHLGPGIFVRSKMNGEWDNPKKLTSILANPLFAKDKNGNSCVFWRAEGKGIFLSTQEEDQWSAPRLVVNEEKIGLYNMPWDVKSDQTGNFHIVYSRQRENSSDSYIVDLIYVYLEGQMEFY